MIENRSPPYPFENERYVGTVTQVGPSSVRANLPLAGRSGNKLHHGHRIAGGEVGEFVLIACDELALFGRVLEVRLPERERLSVEPELGDHPELHPVGVTIKGGDGGDGGGKGGDAIVEGGDG